MCNELITATGKALAGPMGATLSALETRGLVGRGTDAQDGRRVVLSVMIAGLASSLPKTLASGLQHQGVPSGAAHQIGSLPPVSSCSRPSSA